MLVEKATKKLEKTNASLSHRLTAYANQAKQYRSDAASTKVLPDWKRTTLAALIPLAAATAAQAQCKGPLGPFALNANQMVDVDVDADAVNDIRIKVGPVVTFGYPATWFVTAINPAFYIALSSLGRARGVQDGIVVTRGQAFGGGQRVLCSSFGFGQFCLSSTTRSIGVRKGDAATGQPGWVRLAVASTFGTYSFNITDRGVEAPTNVPPNSAIVNNCASLEASLSVELIRFNAKAKGKQIDLAWATSAEINNSGFEVQRSTDGAHFAKIGWVQGLGSSSTGKAYSFVDNEVQPNTSYYYRLHQLDHNGTGGFTRSIAAVVKDNGALKVAQLFPNPASQRQGSVNFQVDSPTLGEIDIQVFDARGGLVQQQTQAIAEGENAISLPIGDRAAGLYFVKMQLGAAVSYERLVIEE